jgi:type III secretion protein Q
LETTSFAAADGVSDPALAPVALPMEFEPIAPDQAKAANRFYCRRRPFRVESGGRIITFATKWLASAPPIIDDDRYSVRVRIDSRDGEIVLPAAVVDALLRGVAPSLAIASLAPEHAALALELATAQALDAIEVAIGCRILLVAVWPFNRAPKPVLQPSLDFTLELDGLATATGLMALPSADIIRLMRCLDRCAPHDPATADDVVLTIRLRLAAAKPTTRELKSLGCGDVMLPEDICLGGPDAVAVIGDHLIAPVSLQADGFRLLARPVAGRGSAWEWSMDRSSDGSQTGLLDDTDLDGVPVRVQFEIGRVELPLGEVRRLGPGSLVPLARIPDRSVDILAHGKRIGLGSLVKIGDSLGVRIIRMFDHA